MTAVRSAYEQCVRDIHWELHALSVGGCVAAATPPSRNPTSRPSARPEGAGGLSVRTISLIAGAVFYVASLVIFRDVLTAIPSVLRGQAVIAGDELVPFFNVHTQLLDQAAGEFNELVNGYEFRVRYAFLTTWLRYYKVLPFAILIVIPSLFWVTYLTVARFMDKVFTSLSSQAIYLATFFPVVLDLPDHGLLQGHPLLHADPRPGADDDLRACGCCTRCSSRAGSGSATW